jgi:hypothetical protein
MLTPRQERLERELRTRSPRLADMYASALRVLSDEDNVDRLALAGHGIREVIEKLPAYLDVPTPVRRPSLMPRVRELHDQWTVMVRKTTSVVGTAWNGAVDAHLQGFLERVRAFFEGLSQDFPYRKQAVRSLLKGLKIGSLEVSEPLEDLNIKVWMELNDYFVSVSHHHESDVDTFNINVARFERLLLDRLSPQTFDDFAAIDDILAEDDNAK